jgi:hypothetical protein
MSRGRAYARLMGGRAEEKLAIFQKSRKLKKEEFPGTM